MRGRIGPFSNYVRPHTVEGNLNCAMDKHFYQCHGPAGMFSGYAGACLEELWVGNSEVIPISLNASG